MEIIQNSVKLIFGNRCEQRHHHIEAVIVEGNPRNYNPRGFETSYPHGIVAGPNLDLPAVECLMVKELVPGALDGISGQVSYSDYDCLT